MIDDDDTDFKPTTKGILSNGSTSNTPKKLKKTDDSSLSSSPHKTSPKKRSPNKENIISHTKISPKKNLLTHFEGQNKNADKIDEVISDKKKERPLSTVPENENKIQNHVPPNINNESCVFESGNKSEDCRQIVLTPKIKSPFKNKNSPHRRTSKKSPLQGMN